MAIVDDSWSKAATELLKGRPLASLTSVVDGVTLDPLYVEGVMAFQSPVVPTSWRSGETGPLEATAGETEVSALADVARGANAPLELALLVGRAIDLVRREEKAGADVEAAADRLLMTVSTGRDILVTVAKLRALRVLWAKVRFACGFRPAPLRICAVTGVGTLAARDPWNNLVRGTFETIGAALGGADHITVTPYDAGLGDSDLGRRLAWTLPAVVALESHVTAEAAEGAYAIEAATDELVRKAWAIFQGIEAHGGMDAAGALIEGLVDACRTAREKDLARRKTIVVGVNDFAPIDDAVFPEGPPGFREAAGWEALARRAIQCKASVSLVNLGARKAWAARAEFATRLFQAAGFQVKEAGADGVVLCGADDEYPTQLAALVPAPSGKFVVLAGQPREREAEYRALGVTDFVFVGADVLTLLNRLVDRVEAAR